MDTTLAGNGQLSEASPRRQEVSNLIADVQDLLGRVGHIADPEITQLRSRVEHGIALARKTLVDGSTQVQRSAQRALSAGDGYVREQPWQAVGVAAVAGLVLGFLAGRR